MPEVLPLTPDTAGPLGAILADVQNLTFVGGTSRTDVQFAGLLAHRPELMRTVLDHYMVLLSSGEISPRLKELMRLTIADAVGCNRYCVNVRLLPGRGDGVTEQLVKSVRDFSSGATSRADGLAPDEAAVLAFALCFANDPAGLEPHFEALRQHFTNSQIVELGIAAATFKGFGSMVAAFGLEAAA